ncbi:kinetochore protein Nuf2 [Cetorhinus maximus]
MQGGQYPGQQAEGGCERSSLDAGEPVKLISCLEAAGISRRSEIPLINVGAPQQRAKPPATGAVSLGGGGEFGETCGEDRGNIFEELPQQPMCSRTRPGVEIIAGVHAFKSGKTGDGIGSLLLEGEAGQDSEPLQGDELREGEGVSNSCNLTTEELEAEIKNIRVKYASSQAEIGQLTDKLNCSHCKVELLELELDAAKERNQQQTRRIDKLEKELRSNFALIGVLSDCKSKVEQLEELKQSSQELQFKFQESKETAIHLRKRITELEFQQATKEQRIKELMDQLSQCMKTTETKNEMEKQQEELLNHQSLSRMREQIVHTQNEPINHQRKNVSHSSPPATNTSKVCIIL